MEESRIGWPELTASYRDEFGPIDIDIYRAAGEVWPNAEKISRTVLHDVPTGLRLMLRAAAIVTNRRRKSPGEIREISAYLSVAFKKLLFAELRRESNHRRTESEIVPPGDIDLREYQSELDRKILIHELMEAMDDWTRQVFQLLCLGYEYKEMELHLQMKANVIRSRYSKQMDKLRKIFSR